jgi:hypothetical protein
MTVDEAFRQLTLDHVETALAADEAHGFPQDVFGLARFMMRTLAVLAPDSGIDSDAAIDKRIAEMMDLEQCEAEHGDDASWSAGQAITRH